MAILGAHKSIAGGHYRAVERAAQHGCDCVQLFTANGNQWAAKDITVQQARLFQAALAQFAITHPIAHDSYLINLASPDRALWIRSIEALAAELRRAETLGLESVVTHPGAYTTSNEQQGLRRIATALDEVHAQTRGLKVRCLLETTAGQGTCLGARFEHLVAILDAVRDPDRLGVCLDTCHAFAAGYPLRTKRQYEATMAQLERSVGLSRVSAIHLNDSRHELGSHRDRHEHIGRGKLGLAAFRHVVCDPRFAQTPMYLETPKGEEDGVDLDMMNLATLRGLAGEGRLGRNDGS